VKVLLSIVDTWALVQLDRFVVLRESNSCNSYFELFFVDVVTFLTKLRHWEEEMRRKQKHFKGFLYLFEDEKNILKKYNFAPLYDYQSSNFNRVKQIQLCEDSN